MDTIEDIIYESMLKEEGINYILEDFSYLNLLQGRGLYE